MLTLCAPYRCCRASPDAAWDSWRDRRWVRGASSTLVCEAEEAVLSCVLAHNRCCWKQVGAFGADDGLLDVNPAPAPALAPPRKKSRHGKHRSSRYTTLLGGVDLEQFGHPCVCVLWLLHRHHKSKSTKEKKKGKTAKTPRPSSKSKAAKGGASSGGGAASSSAAASASTTTGTIAAVKPVV